MFTPGVDSDMIPRHAALFHIAPQQFSFDSARDQTRVVRIQLIIAAHATFEMSK